MRFTHLCLIFLLLPLSACQSKITQQVVNTPTSQPLFEANTAAVEPSPTPQMEELVTPSAAPVFPTAFDMNARLGRGVNLGNALEAPAEGEWGVTLQDEYFRLIKEKGFQSVRVPIRWSAHTEEQSPYTIDPAFFGRIDWVIEQAQRNDLAVIINIHHYYELMENPGAQRERFLAIWEQIAAHFQDAPETVLFELLNEPNGSAITAEVWNELAAAVLEKVRETNPNRYVVIGPVGWNSVDELGTLKLPADDQHIIGTFHYYQPFEFTHQGAEWMSGSDQWLGTTWDATSAQKESISNDLDKALRWSEENHRPVLLGEFGAYSRADIDSRARWTAYMAREAEARGLSWSYWEFCSGFGIYDPKQKSFFVPLLDALIPPG